MHDVLGFGEASLRLWASAKRLLRLAKQNARNRPSCGKSLAGLSPRERLGTRPTGGPSLYALSKDECDTLTTL